MANWKKTEAGYLIIRSLDNPEQFFCSKFHNKVEMDKLLKDYQWINATIEYKIGTFANNAEIEAAIANEEEKKVSFFVEPAEYNPKRIIDGFCKDLTEEKVMEKWNSVKEQGRIYTNEEAQDLGLKEWWGYHDAQLPEGRRKLDMLVAQNKLNNDDEKDFFYTSAVKHIIVDFDDYVGRK